MSLLVLADAAVAERDGERPAKVGTEAWTQTEEAATSTSANPSTLFAPIPSPVHDYTAQADSDVLVNLNHDYYHRVPVQEGECEHSYAFPVPQSYSNNFPQAQTSEGEIGRDYSLLDGLENIQPALRFESNVIEEVLVNGFPQENWIGDLGVVSQDCDFHQLLEYIDEPGTLNDFHDQDNLPANKHNIEESSFCLWEGCSSQFSEKEKLFTHVKSEHCKKGSDLRCHWRDCERRNPFIKRYLLERHVRSHTAEKPFDCFECQKQFATKELLVIHSRRHSGVKKFSCSHCQKEFVSSGSRRKHELIHLEKKIFSCDHSDCSSQFASKDALNKHKKRKKH